MSHSLRNIIQAVEHVTQPTEYNAGSGTCPKPTEHIIQAAEHVTQTTEHNAGSGRCHTDYGT
jgi:hypothetical protein